MHSTLNEILRRVSASYEGQHGTAQPFGRGRRDFANSYGPPGSSGQRSPGGSRSRREETGTGENQSDKTGGRKCPSCERISINSCRRPYPPTGDMTRSGLRPVRSFGAKTRSPSNLSCINLTELVVGVTGGAAFSVWCPRQLDIRRRASSIWAAVIRDPMTLNRSLLFPRNPAEILAHVYART